MGAFHLIFSSIHSPELYRTIFRNYCRGRIAEHVSVRGKSGGPYRGAGSFQWTAAVQALSLLTVQTKIAALQGKESFILEGTQGSAAASLGFALSRQSGWLQDMFGIDARGQLSIRHLIRGTNLSSKRDQPTAIRWNLDRVSADEIHIFVGDEKIRDLEKLQALAYSIERAILGNVRERSSPTRTFPSGDASVLSSALTPPIDADALLSIFRAEVVPALGQADIFTNFGIQRELDIIYKSAELKRLGVGSFSLHDSFSKHQSTSERLGFDSGAANLKAYLEDQPLRIAVPPAFSSSAVIFNFLRFERGLNIIPDFQYAYSQEVVEEILSSTNESASRPDGCVLGLSTAIVERQLAAEEHGAYAACMLLPRISSRVIGNRSVSRRKRQLSYILPTGRSHALSLFFSKHLARNNLKRSRVSVFDFEPDETSLVLKSEKEALHALMWFPNYNFNVLLNSCELVDEAAYDLSYQGVVLLLSRERTAALSYTRALLAAIRDAWLTLKENRLLLERELSRLAHDEYYFTRLIRYGGVSHMQREASSK